jgi:hypothetical protein
MAECLSVRWILERRVFKDYAEEIPLPPSIDRLGPPSSGQMMQLEKEIDEATSALLDPR